jgi:hypothetical protein
VEFNMKPVSLTRIAAFSIAITMLAPPIAWAQEPQPRPATPPTVLLSASAFARLMRQSPADGDVRRVVKDPPRESLRRQVTAAARHAPGAQASPPAPRQRSWAARNKLVIGILAAAGAFFGLYYYVDCVASGEYCG